MGWERYRKKPVEIEAMEITPENADALNALDDVEVLRAGDDGFFGVKVFTLEGVMQGDPGDFLIRGVKRELYPCKPDVFRASYDSAEGANA